MRVSRAPAAPAAGRARTSGRRSSRRAAPGSAPGRRGRRSRRPYLLARVPLAPGAAGRLLLLLIAPPSPALHEGERKQHAERDEEQDDRDAPRPRRNRRSRSGRRCTPRRPAVLNGMLPEIRTTEPNSPMARANASAGAGDDRRAAGSAGRSRRKIVKPRAPSEAAASSTSWSSSISTGCTERTTNGSVTNSSASSTRGARVGEVRRRPGCRGRRGPAASARRRSSAARTGGR